MLRFFSFRALRLPLLLLLIGGFAALSSSPASAQSSCSFEGELEVDPQELVSFGDPVLGNPSADVLLIEFFDPNCPHCQRFKPVMDQVMETYGDQVRYYKHPLPLWQYSVPQIQAILLAGERGKYYEMIDQQLENPSTQGGLSRSEVLSMAEDIGIDRAWLKQKLQNGAKRDEVQRLAQQAREAGVDSTPTLAIGNKIVGSRSAACIGQLIDQEVAAASSTEEGASGRK